MLIKMFITNIFIISILVLSIECLKSNANIKCDNKSIETIDRQFGLVLPILSGNKLPVNTKQLRSYCDNVDEAMDSGLKFVRSCVGNFGPFMAHVVQIEYKKNFNIICKSESNEKISEFLSAGQCLNSVRNKLSKCGKSGLEALMALNLLPEKDRLNTACCQSHKLHQCIMNSASKSKRCQIELTKNDRKFELDIMEEYMNDFCGRYYSNDTRCEKLIAKSSIPLPNTVIKPKSFFPPIISLLESYRNIECTDQIHQRMDNYVAEMITIGKPNPLPENQKQLKQYCNKMTKNIPFVYGYMESCLSKFIKMMTKLAVPIISTNAQPICDPRLNILGNPNELTLKYIDVAKCVNKAEDKLTVCMNEYIDDMEGIIRAPDVMRMKMGCCISYKLRNCIINATSATKGCAQHTIQWADRMFEENSRPVIDMVCGNHWNSDNRCQTLLAQIPDVKDSTYVRPKSVFMPFIKLLDSFPDIDLDSE